MANDQLFYKRKAAKPATKKSLARHHSSREPRQRALIICEDAVSAPAYFRKLINYLQLNTVDVQVFGESGSAPISVVNFGEKYLEADWDFDHAFFVFDKDRHESYDRALVKITGLQRKKRYGTINIHAITSVPCFELWLLLHHRYSAKPYHATERLSPADNLIKDIKKLVPFQDYRKDKQCAYFERIKDQIDVAIKHAERLLKNHHAETKPHHVNPSTRMHELVQTLQKIAKSY